jgi:uncharacterized membrane protein YqjE
MSDDIRRDHGESDPSLPTLFRRLTDDARRLVHQEIDLARTELEASLVAITRNALLLALGVATGLLGLVVLLAFLVVGLGALLGNYWLSALLIGGALLVVGLGIVLRSRTALRRSHVAPVLVKQTLQEDTAWLRAEVEEIQRDLRT